ncbi:YopX family protein [Streptococcus suis]|uniref:YopX family protein n=1 Tax=Streptococcus suis TaxID=1307 RepID=UPI001479392E|nr:YopX family protein [Streptococcus suis]
MIPKFRVWDTEHGQWSEEFFVYSKGGLYTPNYGFNRKHLKNRTDVYPIVKQERLILMQSTGLFDKNGKEIFEGDVVLENGWRKVAVSFGTQEIEENFGDKRIFQGFNLYLGGGYPEAVMSKYEIIGNVWEGGDLIDLSNPEAD